MPKGRPRNFDFENTLDSAMRLFWKKGYEASSMQDLMQVMKLSKSSLYQCYGSKEELFMLCLQRYLDKVFQELEQDLSRNSSGKQFIQRYFQSIIAEAEQGTGVRGCYLVNAAVEFEKSHTTISPMITRGLERFRELFHTALEMARKNKELSQDYDPHVISHYLVSSMGGLRTMVKGGMRYHDLQEVVAVTLRCMN